MQIKSSDGAIRIDNYNYAVTINTKRPAQYMPDTELAQFQ